MNKNRHIIKISLAVIAILGWIALPFIIQDKVEAEASEFGTTYSESTLGTPSPSPSVSPTASPTPGNPGDLYAGLSGTVNGVVGFGFAQFEVHSSRLELEIRVRQINLPAGTVLTAFVNGNQVGQFQLESDREGRLRLRTDRGEPVPQITSGMSAQIRANGTTILSGTFTGFSATPSPTPTGSPSPSPSPGFGRYFETHPTGSGMIPPVSTNATGEIKILLNAEETLATISGEFRNLSSSQTSATIAVDIGGDLTTIYNLGTIGGTNGNISTRTVGILPAQVTQLRAGMFVATIASANNPSGEIRGRLIQHSDRSDFNGDGNNDFSVFRPSNGTWFTQNSSGFSAAPFGISTDQIVSGDYDGDGKTDVAVFRSGGGVGSWYILRSSDNGFTGLQFGADTDVPVRGDYDGDGRSDIAVFRPSNGTWYISRSSDNGFRAMTFGFGTDKPMAQDYDGDGKTDIAVFRPSNGAWYVSRSSDNGFQAATFGASTDVPVRGDFDGDGKADYTVYRPSSGNWFILKSSDGGFQAATFGASEDIPVAGIYDGDNKTDIAVFRPSTGGWYILRSSDNGFEGVIFGANGDVPVISR